MACYIPRWHTRPKTVTHPGTNRARRALTSFMRRTPLTTTPRRVLWTRLETRLPAVDHSLVVTGRFALKLECTVDLPQHGFQPDRLTACSCRRFSCTHARPLRCFFRDRKRAALATFERRISFATSRPRCNCAIKTSMEINRDAVNHVS